MIDIQTFESKINPKLHGTTLAKISGVYEKMREAAANMSLRAKSPTTIRRSRIENAIFDKVYSYTAQDDLTIGSLVDLRPLGDRSSDDSLTGAFSQDFDIKKEYDTALIEYVNGTRLLRLSKELTTRTVLHRMDSLTTEGTITLGGDASGAEINLLEYITGSGALEFDLDGVTGQATIQIDLTTAVDLSDMLSIGSLFYWLNFADVSALTSVDLEWGSSDTVYWNETATAAHDRTFAEAGDRGWMLLRHEWVDATANGSADETASESVDYLKITINYTAGTALSNNRLDSISASKGEAWEVMYYSNRLFTDSTGTTWKEIPTTATDLIQLDPDGLNIFMYEFLLTVLPEIKGKHIAGDMASYRLQLEGDTRKQRPGLYELFAEKYPDQSLVRQVEYHQFDDIGSITN